MESPAPGARTGHRAAPLQRVCTALRQACVPVLWAVWAAAAAVEADCSGSVSGAVRRPPRVPSIGTPDAQEVVDIFRGLASHDKVCLAPGLPRVSLIGTSDAYPHRPRVPTGSVLGSGSSVATSEAAGSGSVHDTDHRRDAHVWLVD